MKELPIHARNSFKIVSLVRFYLIIDTWFPQPYLWNLVTHSHNHNIHIFHKIIHALTLMRKNKIQKFLYSSTKSPTINSTESVTFAEINTSILEQEYLRLTKNFSNKQV